MPSTGRHRVLPVDGSRTDTARPHSQAAPLGTTQSDAEAWIEHREQQLRSWFTADADPVLRQIDGLDIGWGDVQRWATARIPAPEGGPHLDIACGYATFLAELGWRFPNARLVGLNIDFEGPHALARPLLAQAGVQAVLVRADGRRMPFVSGLFSSVSCFLGLQDIEIGFGEPGVRCTVAEAVRVLRTGGVLVLLDDFPFERFEALLEGQPVRVTRRAERQPDVRWSRQVAERAIGLYAEGYRAQARAANAASRRRLLADRCREMRADMERQLSDRGYYVPFAATRMVVARKGLGIEARRSW
jgi:SAM-dependent methyltransferase